MSNAYDEYKAIFDEYDEAFDTKYRLAFDAKKKGKKPKTNWRDVEVLKEKQRLRRDLTDHSEYYF